MRLRKISTAFWIITVCAGCFILYVLTDLSFNLPSIKPVDSFEDVKLTELVSKIEKMERQINQHNAVVKDLKNSINKLDNKPKRLADSHEIPMKVVNNPPPYKVQGFGQEDKNVGAEPPVLFHRPKFNESMCPLQRYVMPETNVQMLDLYERMSFEDADGGVWKQGWNIEYSDKQWTRKNKLKVIIMPHSHNDPGWIKTFENYYRTQTKAIFDNMVVKLSENSARKFIWAEISFLSLWWHTDATDTQKDLFKTLLNSGQLEIVTGGWVMNDEANSHFLSIIQQLTSGHQWLLNNLGYVPKNSWANDPFGLSSTQPYLLKLAGFHNSVIQRVHYSVKKELAQKKQLEFRWRQIWDSTGDTELFTQVMPFYSYDIPHTCGPDPKICCQFDFRRLPGHGITCPWGVPPKKIIQKNVAERSFAILDQWRKKAQLFKSNVVLVPLGDDFRYDNSLEWDEQYGNYEMLIDYINNNDAWNVEVQFGTLQDYFKALHSELSASEFPTLSGDFFTYADRNQHYWSGYYTSRPFYKRMDRVLLSYVRSAELLISTAVRSSSISNLMWTSLRDRVDGARRHLSLFQHHDGVTGTSRDPVVQDYALKLLSGIKYCQSALQQSAYYLLNQPSIKDQNREDVFFDVDDAWRAPYELPSRMMVTLDIVSPTRRVVFYNSLGFTREEVVTVYVNTVHVEVFNPEGEPIKAQVSPALSGPKKLGLSNNKFQLSFLIKVDAFSVKTYTVSMRDPMAINKHTSFASVRIFNAEYWKIDLPVFKISQPGSRVVEEFTVGLGGKGRVAFNDLGLLKAVIDRQGVVTPVHMDIIQYGSQMLADNNSGGYLFMPDGPATNVAMLPELVAIEGDIYSAVYVGISQKTSNVADFLIEMSIVENPSLPQSELRIRNTFEINPKIDDVEIGIRFSTDISSKNEFYTDLNGYQLVKRRRLVKLPLQANMYPMPGAAYIQDSDTRLTILTSTPLGVASYASGQIEVIQDRRLSRDDNLGMSQGVQDNVMTRHEFKIIIENRKPCQSPPLEVGYGHLSLGAFISQQTLLHPMVPMSYTPKNPEDKKLAYRPPYLTALGVDIVLASFRADVSTKVNDKVVPGIGMTFQRTILDTCFEDKSILVSYPLSDGQVNITEILNVTPEQVYESTLTHNTLKSPLKNGLLTLCPMEIRSVFVRENRKT